KSELFDKALAGEESRGYFVSRGELLQMVVVPVFDNVAADLVRGTVALAYAFSADMAEEINSLTASEIGFFVFTRNDSREIDGVQSTYTTNEKLGNKLNAYFQANSEQWQAIYNSEAFTSDMRLMLNDEDFYSVVHRVSNDDGSPLGFIMALRSRTELI